MGSEMCIRDSLRAPPRYKTAQRVARDNHTDKPLSSPGHSRWQRAGRGGGAEPASSKRRAKRAWVRGLRVARGPAHARSQRTPLRCELQAVTRRLSGDFALCALHLVGCNGTGRLAVWQWRWRLAVAGRRVGRVGMCSWLLLLVLGEDSCGTRTILKSGESLYLGTKRGARPMCPTVTPTPTGHEPRGARPGNSHLKSI